MNAYLAQLINERCDVFFPFGVIICGRSYFRVSVCATNSELSNFRVNVRLDEMH